MHWGQQVLGASAQHLAEEWPAQRAARRVSGKEVLVGPARAWAGGGAQSAGFCQRPGAGSRGQTQPVCRDLPPCSREGCPPSGPPAGGRDGDLTTMRQLRCGVGGEGTDTLFRKVLERLADVEGLLAFVSLLQLVELVAASPQTLRLWSLWRHHPSPRARGPHPQGCWGPVAQGCSPTQEDTARTRPQAPPSAQRRGGWPGRPPSQTHLSSPRSAARTPRDPRSYRHCWCPSAGRSYPSASPGWTRPQASSSRRTPFCK